MESQKLKATIRMAGAICLCLCGVSVYAQSQQTGRGVSVGIETTRDRFHYRFENPSNFDTVELVPHEFTQTYWADNQWLVVRGRFGSPQRLFKTELAATVRRTTRGDDYDTFFQPGGDVVVGGTTGDVVMRSWRARQTIGTEHQQQLGWNIGYEIRHDRSVFGPGLKTIRHSRPASLETSIIYTRETTKSTVYGLVVGAERQWRRSNWLVNAGIESSPFSQARLTTLLPDKYPGETIIFSAFIATINPSVTITYGKRWPISLTGSYLRTFSYKHSSQFIRDTRTIGISLGYRM